MQASELFRLSINVFALFIIPLFIVYHRNVAKRRPAIEKVKALPDYATNGEVQVNVC